MLRTSIIPLLAVLLAWSVRASAEPPSSITVKAKPKPHHQWRSYPTRTIDQLAGFTPVEGPPKLGRYGGLGEKRFRATGFFRTEKIAGRWMMVDPDGHPLVNMGVNSVRPPKPDSPPWKTMHEKMGGPKGWADWSSDLLRDAGFNSTGMWSDNETLAKSRRRLPYTTSSNFVTGFARDLDLTRPGYGHAKFFESCIPVFHPGFEEYCDRCAKALADSKEDPYLIGHFTDNELPVPRDLLVRTLRLDPGHAALKYNRQAARQWWRRRKGPAATVDEVTPADNLAWLGFVMERYFEATARAIRRHDPNHLCLGCRFHGAALTTAEVFRAAGKHVDVISVNYYWHWTPDPGRMAMWTREGGKPFLITEWYTKGADTPLANEAGAGWIVPCQADRGRFYQNWTLALLENENCVGWHWFKYRDDKRPERNGESNKGIISADFRRYDPLLRQMRRINHNAYALLEYFDRR